MPRIVILITLAVFAALTLKSQPVDKGLELRAGYMYENFYDRNHARMSMSGHGFMLGLGYAFGCNNIHSGVFTYSAIPGGDFKGTDIGRSTHTAFSYNFWRGKPFASLWGINIYYGFYAGYTYTHRNFPILVNNSIMTIVSGQLGPSVALSRGFSTGNNASHRIGYSLVLPVAGLTVTNSLGENHKFKPVLSTFNRRIFIDSDINYSVNIAGFRFRAGYKWIYENSRVNSGKSIYGSHHIYTAIIL